MRQASRCWRLHGGDTAGAVDDADHLIDIHLARERRRLGDIDGSIELARTARTEYLRSLLFRGTEADLIEARDVTNGLAATPTGPGAIIYEVWLLRMRALPAQAEGDDATYRDHRDRYRKMASDLGFEGHMKWAAELV